MTPHSLQDREGPGRLRNQAQTVQCCIPAQGWALTNDRFLRAVMQYRNTLDQDTGLPPTHIIFHIWKTARLPPQSPDRVQREWILLHEDREKALAKELSLTWRDWVTHQLLTSPPHQVLLGPSQVYPGSHGSSVQLQLHNFYVQSCGLLQEGPHLSLPWHEVLGLRGGEEQGGQEKAVRLLKKFIKDVMAQIQTHITLIQLSPSYLRMKQLSSLASIASPKSRSWGKPGRSWLLRES